MPTQIASIRTASSAVVSTNKLIRNTYMLLSMTLLFSAVTATLSVMLHMPRMTYLVSVGIAIALMWFVLPRTARSSSGLGVVFAITGLLGFALGPFRFIRHTRSIPEYKWVGQPRDFGKLTGFGIVSRKYGHGNSPNGKNKKEMATDHGAHPGWVEGFRIDPRISLVPWWEIAKGNHPGVVREDWGKPTQKKNRPVKPFSGLTGGLMIGCGVLET